MIDGIDLSILSILQKNARTPNVEIARRVGMAPSAILERIRKLEEKGVIRAYTAVLDPAALDRSTLAFILVRAKSGGWGAAAGRKLAALEEVEEVHHIAGEDCFLIKVRVRDTNALGALLRDRLTGIDSIGGTRTTIVLETVKEGSIASVSPKSGRKQTRRKRT